MNRPRMTEKKSRILELLLLHSRTTDRRIAKQAKCSAQYVLTVRRNLGRPRKRRPIKFPGLAEMMRWAKACGFPG